MMAGLALHSNESIYRNNLISYRLQDISDNYCWVVSIVTHPNVSSHHNHNWFTSVLYQELESTVETKIKGQILQVF